MPRLIAYFGAFTKTNSVSTLISVRQLLSKAVRDDVEGRIQ